MKSKLIRLFALALLAGPMAANAQLTAVTSDGATLIDDSTLNVTWVADASLSGIVTWAGAQAWVSGLNAENYGGYNDWTLPTGDGTYTDNSGPCAGFGFTPGSGCGASTSGANNQLGYLFINELGNAPLQQVTQSGPFLNLNPNAFYWSDSTTTNNNAAWAWGLSTLYTYQYSVPQTYELNAIAVRAGLASVPEPNSAGLVLVALAGVLVALRSHRRSRTSA